MNPQTKDNKEKTPNFDFILQQQGPGIPSAPGAHKPNKKIIVLLVLVVVMIVMLIVGAVLSARNNVQEQPDIQEISQDEVPAEQATAQKFLGYIKSGDYEQARTLINSGTEFTKEQFDGQVKSYWNYVAIDKCTFATAGRTSEDPPVTTVTYTCPVNFEQPLVSQLTFSFVNGNNVINKYEYSVQEAPKNDQSQ
jgi:hypothetical protein